MPALGRHLSVCVSLETNTRHPKGKRIREKLRVEPPISAYDQDAGINARLRYSIVLGNENGFFEMNAQTGELFLVREIDLERLPNPTLSLQVQASQVDNPFRQAMTRVDISVQDINDNSPEVSFDPKLLLPAAVNKEADIGARPRPGQNSREPAER